MKILIDGYGLVAQSVLRKLLNIHRVPSSNIFVNTYDSPENYQFKFYCLSRGIKVYTHSYNENELLDEINNFNPEVLLSIYARRIIPTNIIAKSSLQSFNFHPSLLPNYKVCFSCPWAIINGENVTGITIHELAKEIDAGSIIFQKVIQISKYDTAFSLYNKCALEFIINFDEFYSSLLSKTLIPEPMKPGGHYYPRKLPYNGFIDSSWPLHKIDAFIRAMHFPPHPAAILKKNSVEVEVNSVSEYIKLVDQ